MARLTNSLLRSRAFRKFVSTLENKLPPVREWHRFQYQVHFDQHTSKARLFSGVYKNTSEAMAAIPAGALVGQDNEEIAARHASETQRLWPSDYPVLFWLKSLLHENSRVFDFGGAAGISFYSFEKYLHYPSGSSWIVCDVPEVAAKGEELARTRGAVGLSFTTEFGRANDADVLFASGSLQFIEEPLSSLISKLEKQPRHLLINRTPFCDTPDFVTLHNTGPTICPYRIRNLSDFIAGLEGIGYSLLDSWQTPDLSCYIPFHPERAVEAYRGMYFTQRKV
jgi:putative methyltransferase (TIGR04325 family)